MVLQGPAWAGPSFLSILPLDLGKFRPWSRLGLQEAYYVWSNFLEIFSVSFLEILGPDGWKYHLREALWGQTGTHGGPWLHIYPSRCSTTCEVDQTLTWNSETWAMGFSWGLWLALVTRSLLLNSSVLLWNDYMKMDHQKDADTLVLGDCPHNKHRMSSELWAIDNSSAGLWACATFVVLTHLCSDCAISSLQHHRVAGVVAGVTYSA